ncbi:nuclear transport factor 2 family protein [Paenibacillus glycanilyticus]|uniref:nuclear transport factor 2 family protein n=1 Tax=Paenibacillus glycanilyticus TaxID=126569 RepID=UPI0019103303|nr:nuclear transport factor 2 family protein [Paenibacillus glycanilyticus]
MNQTELQQRRIDSAVNYFRYVEVGDPRLMALFKDNATIYFPKVGMVHGKDEIGLLAQGFGALDVASMEHDIKNFNIMPSGDYVVIEGQVKGTTNSGEAFPSNAYSHGRFCNVFEFDGDLISGVNVYQDPDFKGEDAPRVEWAKKVQESIAQHRNSR